MAAPSKRSSRPTPVRKAWRSLTWLGVIIALLFGINAAGVIWGEGSWTPKLALDLEGGTQIILAPQVESGADVSQEQLDQAVSIIRQRVDASGVAEAEINTAWSSCSCETDWPLSTLGSRMICVPPSRSSGTDVAPAP